ncbi:PQQ-binding-like beta-propeller repeat protein [Streptomyces sp. NPDC006703]|uniref:protein kinase domain-containing protein n=1 Tax=Streptomyces sp. NPDC006703 TaxID=3364759 RepID=UPI0036D03DB2
MRVLAGRYELMSIVGRGGMGEVWEGHDRVIGRRVAVKLMPYGQGGAGAELFFREARTAGGLSHRGVVTVYDMGQDPGDGTLFLVMEFVSGRDLGAVLRDEGPPPVEVTVDWALQIVSALGAAHAAGIVHRDLKPANLMLTPDGEVKVLDFGIARFIEATDKASAVMGTLAYMAPERFDGHSGDARCDLYAFGCVLHELLTGGTPFQGTGPVSLMTAHLHKVPVPPGELRAGIPVELDHLVLSLLAKAPADRPATAAEVQRVLRTLSVSNQPTASRSPAPGSGSFLRTPTEPAPYAPGSGAVSGASALPHHLPTQPATPPALAPRPVPDQTTQPPSLTRRRALKFGLGAAAVAALGTGVTLLPWGNNSDAGKNRAPSGKPVGTLTAGTVVWHFDEPVMAGSYGPALSDGVLYAKRDSETYAVDASTGRELWRGSNPTAHSIGHLTAGGGMVFTVGQPKALVALKSDGGTTAWTFTAGDDVDDATVAQGVVYVGSLDKHLHALDAATGAKKWDFATGDFIVSPATVDSGTVYVGSDDKNLYALNAATGTKKWSFQGGRSFQASPAVAGGLVYALNNDQILYALDAATGAKKWSAPLYGSAPAKVYDTPPSPVVAAGTVFASGSDHLLHALDAKTGARKWTYGTTPDIFEPTTPSVHANTVYVGDRYRGTIYALDTATGSKRWAFNSGARMGGMLDAYGPIATLSYVYVANESGLLALATGDGNH